MYVSFLYMFGYVLTPRRRCAPRMFGYLLNICVCLDVLAYCQDLAKTMFTSGTVEGGQGKVAGPWQYIQILIVIPEEVEDYKMYGPRDAVIFALPSEAKDYGIGFSRHFAKKLAEQICPASFPFCLMMDDSVQYWKGITLPKDPLKPFGKNALLGKAVRTDISLADVLLHFVRGLRDDSLKVEEFAMIGFYRLNGWESSQRAFKRTHCTSTVILNLTKLKDVHYLKRAWVFEDLQFNRDAAKQGLVICKCYRFAFYTPQLKKGGCAGMLARPDTSQRIHPDLRTQAQLSEPGSEDQNTAGAAEVPMWLREGMQEDEIAILKDAMQRRRFNERDLQHFNQEALQEAGVESAITRAKMLTRIRDHFKP
jgi:hypothetical protein